MESERRQPDHAAERGRNRHRGAAPGLHSRQQHHLERRIISNSTLAGGALDGNGTFTGITTVNFGTAAAPITIGTPNTGFIMQLGNDLGNSVTLGGANTYTGGTSILAGNLIIAGDSSLGAATPAGATIDLNNIKASVQAANGIIFNSLSEGNGTLTIGTTAGNGVSTFSTARPIAVDGEVATINLNGYIVTLTGQLVSLGSNGIGLGNATGVSDLTIDDTAGNKGVLILSTASPNFYGNLIIGNAKSPTVRVMNDAALGNTSGVAASIGQVDLNGGTLQAGASFAAPERNLFLGGGSSFDVNGFNTSWGNLTDVQRTLNILNSNTTTAGAVTFNSLTIGATATLQLTGGAAGETVTLTNGITRQPGATLVIQPSTAGSLGTATEKLFASTLANTNGIVSPWIVTNNGVAGSAGPYDFVTNGANGLVKATYGATAVGAGTGTKVVDQTGNQTLAANAAAYALKVESGKTVTLGANTLTIGDGTNPAGLSLAAATPISGGTLAFGGSEAVMWLGAASTVNSILTGSGGLTVAGSGSLTLNRFIDADRRGHHRLRHAHARDGELFRHQRQRYAGRHQNETGPRHPRHFSQQHRRLAQQQRHQQRGQHQQRRDAHHRRRPEFRLDAFVHHHPIRRGCDGAGQGWHRSARYFRRQDQAGRQWWHRRNRRRAARRGLGSSPAASPTTNTFALIQRHRVAVCPEWRRSIRRHGNRRGCAASHRRHASTDGNVEQLFRRDLRRNRLGPRPHHRERVDRQRQHRQCRRPDRVRPGDVTGTYSGVISDARQMRAGTGALLSGSLVKDDSTGASGGNVTLAAVQAYSGGTFVEAGTLTLGAANAIAGSSGVDLGRVGGPLGTGAAAPNGPVTATLALGANNTIKGLMNEAGNNTAVQLNSNVLTLNVAGRVRFQLRRRDCRQRWLGHDRQWRRTVDRHQQLQRCRPPSMAACSASTARSRPLA